MDNTRSNDAVRLRWARMKRVLTLIATTAVLAALLSPIAADAAPGDTLPFWLEPAPVCGSDLHLEIGGTCLDPDDAPVRIGTQVCPALSTGRFNGKSYNFSVDELAIVDYNDGPRLPLWQSIDNARTWDRYCVTPFARPVPAPTAAPAPTATPQPIVVECPPGFAPTTGGDGVIRCLAVPSSTPAVPRPAFTG